MDNLTLGLEGFSSELKANNYNRNFMLWGGRILNDRTVEDANGNKILIPGQAPNPGYVVKDGVLSNATFAGQADRDYAVYDMIYRESKAKTNYITFDADWQISDNLGMKFQAGSTKGTGETPRQCEGTSPKSTWPVVAAPPGQPTATARRSTGTSVATSARAA